MTVKVTLEGRCNGSDFEETGTDASSYIDAGKSAAAKVQQFIDTNGPCPDTQAALTALINKLNA